MLMSDMSESERETVRETHKYWIPEGAEIVELVPMLWSGWECDHAMALVRMPDGEVRLRVIGGTYHPGERDPFRMLEERIAAYRETEEDTSRFLQMARDHQRDGLMREIERDFDEIGGLGDGDENPET